MPGPNAIPGLVIVAFVAIAAAALISFFRNMQRRDDIAALARRWGLQYSADDPFATDRLAFSLFEKGDGRGCENVAWGTIDGHAVRLFDYWYYTESRDSDGDTSRTYHRYSCALGQSGVQAPHLELDRETLLTRAANHLGLRDIEFESEEFNRAYRVRGNDQKFAFAVCDPAMMTWLLGAGAGYRYELHCPLALVASGQVAPPALAGHVRALFGFVRHIPAVVAGLYPPVPGNA